ncbi:50S ribosomal protein L1 [candidate division WOR-3 bacterium]|nr:50S ribosomal protein L1 [candidate division WOR-3 bacterium]
MRRHSKRFRAVTARVDGLKLHTLADAILVVRENANARFDESVDVAVKLGVDPKKQDQLVSGTVSLPHGTGKAVRVLVFAKSDKQDEARAAGADFVGFEDMVERITGGWLDFDVVVATPDTMSAVGRLGKVLGPKGLMPSPKTQTVTFDVAATVKGLKAGRIKYRTDKTGNVHALVGKASFAAEQLTENIRTFVTEVLRARPATAKGQFVRNVVVSSTMGPGVRIDPREFTETRKEA